MRGWGALARWAPFFDDGGNSPSPWNGAPNGTFVADGSPSGTYIATSHGIVADGTTDNRSALNSLISTVNAAGGGTIVLPAGTISYSDSIFAMNNVRIQGAGMGTTVLKPAKDGIDYTTGSQAVPLTNFHMSDLSIDGSAQTATYKGVALQYLLRCSFRNLYITNTRATGLGTDFLVGCYIANVITNNTGTDNDGTQPGGNGIGIGHGGWSTLREFYLVEGCVALTAKRFGIMVEDSGNDGSIGARIIGCYASGCGSGGFLDSSSAGTIMEGNVAADNVGPGFSTSRGTLASTGGAGWLGRMANNFAYKNTGPGFLFDASLQAMHGAGYDIVGNTAAANTGQGFKVLVGNFDVTALTLKNNRSWKNGDRGIHLLSTGTGGLIECHFDGNEILSNTTNNMRIDLNMTGGSVSRNWTSNPDTGTANGIVVVSGRTLTSVDISNNKSRGIAAFVPGGATLAGCTVLDNTGYSRTAVLVAGTVTVADTAITATSDIRLLSHTPGGTPGALFVSAKTASTGFTITSTSGSDTSTVAYEVVNY